MYLIMLPVMLTQTLCAWSSLAFQAAPSTCAPSRRHQRHLSPSLLSRTAADGNEMAETIKDQQSKLQQLCADLGSATELVVGEDSNGIRGLYLGASAEVVNKGDELLSIPLSSCLRDDEPPSWFRMGDDEGASSNSYSAGSEWATRLAASLIEYRLQLNEEMQQKQLSTWISMLPDSASLRASLPIHWPSDVLRRAKCQPLERAVDSAYFGRANAVMDLLQALEEVGGHFIDHCSDDEMTRLCHDALDVVQTRTCRVSLGDEDDSVPLRLLAPVFDFLNHGPSANAGFALETNIDGESVLMVRAIHSIARGEEVFISYGHSSTTPTWKCLLSYGFIPNLDITDERNTVELMVEGVKADVGADNVPFKLAEAAARALAAAEDRVLEETDDIFTPEVAQRIAIRASEEADVLLQEDGEMGVSLDEATALSISLAKALRLSQHSVLKSWSLSLMDFVNANS